MEKYKSNLDAPIYMTISSPKCGKCIHFNGFPEDLHLKCYLCNKLGKAPDEYYHKTEHDCPHFVLDPEEE